MIYSSRNGVWGWIITFIASIQAMATWLSTRLARGIKRPLGACTLETHNLRGSATENDCALRGQGSGSPPVASGPGCVSHVCVPALYPLSSHPALPSPRSAPMLALPLTGVTWRPSSCFGGQLGASPWFSWETGLLQKAAPSIAGAVWAHFCAGAPRREVVDQLDRQQVLDIQK